MCFTGMFLNLQKNPMSQAVFLPFLLTLKLRFRERSHLTEDPAAQRLQRPHSFCFPLHSLRRGLSPVSPNMPGAGTWKSLTSLHWLSFRPHQFPHPKVLYDSPGPKAFARRSEIVFCSLIFTTALWGSCFPVLQMG